nr:hypothetical protein CFP56_30990 [Quercus suber]
MTTTRDCTKQASCTANRSPAYMPFDLNMCAWCLWQTLNMNALTWKSLQCVPGLLLMIPYALAMYDENLNVYTLLRRQGKVSSSCYVQEMYSVTGSLQKILLALFFFWLDVLLTPLRSAIMFPVQPR